MGPEDERPHDAGDEETWAEWWYFDFSSPVEGFAGHVRLCVQPNQRSGDRVGRARYWASVVSEPRGLIAVVHDDDVPLPRAGNRSGSIDIRTEGLWASQAVEAPFEQMGVGCEAFGLQLESFDDLRRDPVIGERTAFGLNMEWATILGEKPITGLGRSYALPCMVVGEVMVGADEWELISATGGRSHGWGAKPPPFVPNL